MNKKIKLWVLVISLVILTAIIYALFFRPSYYKFNGGEAHLTPTLTQRFTSDYQTLLVLGNSIYECNTNGLVKKDITGSAVWSKSFYIETPLMVAEGNYIAVADITGKKVYVFNEKGFIRLVEESNELISIHINEHGFLTTVMEDKKRNLINYYNNEGNLVVKRATSYFEDGYPISVASSNDVSKMVTAYLNVNNNRLQSTISFFGFSDQYDKLNELIIGGFTYEDALVNEIIWLDDSTVMAVFDNQIVVYECKKDPIVLNVIELTSEVRQIEVSDDTFEVLYGKSRIKNQKDVSNSVCLYDFTGKEIKQFTFDEPIRSIESTKDGFFVITDSNIIKYIGEKKEWFATTYLTISDFFEFDNGLFLATTEQGYEIRKIREK